MKPIKCSVIYNSVATKPTGGLYPCCRMLGNDDKLYWDDPKDYFNSEYLQDIKDTMNSGEWHSECARCKREEEFGIISKRIRSNKEWESSGNLLSDLESCSTVSRIDLRLKNTCNLMCLTCGPESSSKIFDEISNTIGTKKIPDHYQKNYDLIKLKNLNEPYSEDHIKQLSDIITPNTQIYMTGGEPSLIKPAFRLLERLKEKGYNKTVDLQFNSNFQSFNSKWINLIKDFNGLMMPSIDGTGMVAEYARYPCKWNDVNENLKKFLKECPHWRTKIYVTSSILNIFDLKKMFEWRDTELNPLLKSGQVLKIVTDNKLHTPKCFSIKFLPTELKIQIDIMIDNIFSDHILSSEEYQDLMMLKKFLLTDDDNLLPDAIIELEKFDAIRGTNWKKVLPHLNII